GGRMPGPPPKRDAERVRRNKPDYETDTVVALGEVEVPPLNLRKPKALVQDIYDSHKASAQARYYEPSDWQILRLNLQLLDQELKKPHGVNGQVIATIMSTFTSLMSTEGDRRRL